MKLYGVWKGRKTGIFDNWADCQAQIKGFKGAVYKKLKATNIKDAQVEFDNGFERKTKEEKILERKDKKKSVTTNLHELDEIVYFCDGAAKDNPGSSGAGISIYEHGVLKELVYGSYNEDGSNNIGELEAMVYCLERIKKEAPFDAIVYADSMYVINTLTKWAKGWEKNGWKKADNKPVKNLDLVKKAYSLYQETRMIVEIRKVKAHANEIGNELADRMAIHASNTKEKEWDNYVFNPDDFSNVLNIKHL